MTKSYIKKISGDGDILKIYLSVCLIFQLFSSMSIFVAFWNINMVYSDWQIPYQELYMMATMPRNKSKVTRWMTIDIIWLYKIHSISYLIRKCITCSVQNFNEHFTRKCMWCVASINFSLWFSVNKHMLLGYSSRRKQKDFNL